MTNSSIWQLQKAVYFVLDGDADLNNLINGVYTHVPQQTVLPYLKLAEVDEFDLSTKTSKISRILFSVNAYSNQQTLKEILDIISYTKNILENSSLAMDNFSLSRIEHQNTDVSQLSDGKTWQGIVQFETVIEAN